MFPRKEIDIFEMEEVGNVFICLMSEQEHDVVASGKTRSSKCF